MAARNHNATRSQSPGALQALGQVFSGRDGIILLAFILLASIIFIRLFALTVIEADELSLKGSAMRTTEITLTARRGTLYDRNGNVLATSVDAVTIYANPSKIEDPKETADILHQILGGSAGDYLKALTADPQSTFVYIAKKVDLGYQQEITDANQAYVSKEIAAIQQAGNDIPAVISTPLTGIEFLPDTRREYPAGSTGSQIIGAVNDEGIGVSGLEQAYNSILTGVDGVRIVEEAKRISQSYNPLPMINSVIRDEEPTAGCDIIISIDIEMQQFLEMNLQATSKDRECDNSSGLLLDGSTGEIIAAASIPLYDRERVTSEEVQSGATNVKAITMPFEPGSTFKAIIAAVALEQGLMSADDTIYCPAYLDIYDKTIRDSTEREGMNMSLRQIMANSSNIGVSLIEQQVGDELFYDYLQKLRLGEYTHVDYPGETAGSLDPVWRWTPVQAANISFGQGLEVSLLQMASIYGAIANDGIMIQPHFLMSRPQYDGEVEYPYARVFDAQTARDLEDILRSCVTDGFGINADVTGFDTVGKTGTAEIGSLSGGYESASGSYVCSFAGYLNNSTSNYVFISSFEDPTDFSDSPATTFFSVVMSFAANRYMIQHQQDAPLEAEEQEDAFLIPGLKTISTPANAALRAAGQSPNAATPRAGRDWDMDTTG
ncbi:MAG: penicillin-binding protein 2 [Coriobacteriia bacterium]|nr:penicillin-binding protein 2 [Coriobacteriia bacterium]